ncbi:MAG: repeat protein [Candidatus Acidoferrum typicum]|nr:repeat protein [Candidatus Acidoferrum typicum]
MLRITPLIVGLLSFLLCLGTPAPNLVRSQVAAPPPRLGQVNFPTSCGPEAQPSMETGVALLHSFQYKQADQSFSEAAKRDPKCALAYWGKAMTHYEQLWEFPSERSLKHGAEEIQHAQAAGASTERERGYIAAAAAFYLADSKLSETQRVQAYSTALAELHKKHADDVNAAAFYALSLVALAEQQEVDAQPNRIAAIAILEPLCRKAPNNPGPAHYLIHATDTPEFAPQGLEAARAYSKIAPDSSHALHMPSHIFVRLGLWQESISSNIAASASAAKATHEHRSAPHYQFHALDFLNYSYLQSGQESKAREMVKELENVPGADDESIAEHQAWFAARNAFESHRWKEAAALAIPQVPRESQESTYRVRSIAAAHLRDAGAARQNLAKFVDISSEEQGKSHHHGNKTPDKSVEQMEVEGWVALAERKTDDAVKTLRSAADREDADGVDSLAMPAREMLADMLLELKRPSEALTEYKAALKNSPHRFDSLYGAAHAAQLAGDAAAANAYYAKLMETSAPSADRAELSEAKSYLATASKIK